MRRPSRHAVTGFIAVGTSLFVLAAILYGIIYGLKQGLRSVPW
ncbi:hypothetical protein ABH941_004970 [Streptacidiphilus sp. EB103A]